MNVEKQMLMRLSLVLDVLVSSDARSLLSANASIHWIRHALPICMPTSIINAFAKQQIEIKYLLFLDNNLIYKPLPPTKQGRGHDCDERLVASSDCGCLAPAAPLPSVGLCCVAIGYIIIEDQGGRAPKHREDGAGHCIRVASSGIGRNEREWKGMMQCGNKIGHKS